MTEETQEKTTHFGFSEVRQDEKGGMVQDLFNQVAGNYDLMNDFMSGGIHRIWKDLLIDWLHPRDGMHLLDVAGGTGDVAFKFLRRVQEKNYAQARVTVCDYTPGMLIVGRNRAIDEGFLPSDDQAVRWSCGDAQALPFPDCAFDAYTISFGIRNVTDIEKALQDAYRVLKPGGRFMVLEFSKVVVPILDDIYERFSFDVIPRIGQLVSKDRDSYRYLVESIRKFPDQETFAAMIRAAGFENVSYRNLTGGIAAIHSGWRL